MIMDSQKLRDTKWSPKIREIGYLDHFYLQGNFFPSANGKNTMYVSYIVEIVIKCQRTISLNVDRHVRVFKIE